MADRVIKAANRFTEPRIVTDWFSVNIPRVPEIAQLGSQIGEQLRDSYAPPKAILVPPEIDPLLPRLIFQSHHGFSQIIVSQVSVGLSVTYSPDWQIDADLRRQYILDKVELIYRTLDVLGRDSCLFCGLTTTAELSFLGDDEELRKFMRGRFLSTNLDQLYFDIVLRLSDVVQDEFFVNTTFENFRIWSQNNLQSQILSPISPFPRRLAQMRGLKVTQDFNDRYAFNERKGYISKLPVSRELVDTAFARLEKELQGLWGE